MVDSKNTNNAPSWFKIVAILAIIWNLLGVMAFIGQVMMTPEMMAQLPKAEQELYSSIPVWAVIAFACAVFGGFLGSILLLIKMALATPILIISLVGVIVQMSHSIFMTNSFEVYGPGGMIMPVMVVTFAIGLVFLSHHAKNAGWFK